MTIELITGSPGAGKTTYAVSQRVAKEVGRNITIEETGEVITRRVLVSGVRGLLVEHEKLPHTLTGDHTADNIIEYYNQADEDGNPVHVRLPGTKPVELDDDIIIKGKRYAGGCSLFNWWLWCKPGDLIVVDEIQFIVPRGSLGKKPPLYIALLEIHRHYGIDFLFITQHPQLLDNTIRALVGLHRHVRSVMGSRVCMVYIWDHASNPERFTQANKQKFIRGPKDYALFKSSAAHVKPPSSGRGIFVIVPLLLIGICIGFYKFSARWRDVPVPVASAVAADIPVIASPGGVSRPGAIVAVSPVRPPGYVDVPDLAGCFTTPSGDCRCMDRSSRWVRVDPPMCHASASSYEGLVQWSPRLAQPGSGQVNQPPPASVVPSPFRPAS
jgi:hypothetical protein